MVWEFKKFFVIEIIEVVSFKSGEVRIKIFVIGVCYTDSYIFGGYDLEGLFLCVFGYEGGGIVESVGKGVIKVVFGKF